MYFTRTANIASHDALTPYIKGHAKTRNSTYRILKPTCADTMLKA